MTDDSPKMDLDLIEMVQRARMINDTQATPSEVSAVYWIEAKSPVGQPTPRAGKWIVETTVNAVDALWAQVKAATEAGQLGYKSKVSTAPGKEQGSASARLLHIRVADSADAADVERVRAALERIGIGGEPRYERD